MSHPPNGPQSCKQQHGPDERCRIVGYCRCWIPLSTHIAVAQGARALLAVVAHLAVHEVMGGGRRRGGWRRRGGRRRSERLTIPSGAVARGVGDKRSAQAGTTNAQLYAFRNVRYAAASDGWRAGTTAALTTKLGMHHRWEND